MIKFKLVLLFLIQTIFCLGQNVLDEQLSNVDLSSAKSGIIYERTMQLANLYNFNKDRTFNVANYEYFKQALLEMHRASNFKKFVQPDALNKMSSEARNTVDVAILDTDFDILNFNIDNPSAGGLLFDSIKNKYSQIPNKPAFFGLHTTVIAPLQDATKGCRIDFRFSEPLYFRSGNKAIRNLTANFDNKQTIQLITNGTFRPQTVSQSYTSTGIKTISHLSRV